MPHGVRFAALAQPGLPLPLPLLAPGGVVVVVASSRASLETAPEEQRVCGQKKSGGGEENGRESERIRYLFNYLLLLLIT